MPRRAEQQPTTVDAGGLPGDTELARALRDVRPELLLEPIEVGLPGVARLLGRPVAAVKRLRSQGRLPRPVAEERDARGRVHDVRWRVEDIRLWSEMGHPSPEEFARLVGRSRRAVGRKS